MKRVTIQLPGQARQCVVEVADLQAWSGALLDHVLFEAARQLPSTGAAAPLVVTVTFELEVPADGEAVVVSFRDAPG